MLVLAGLLTLAAPASAQTFPKLSGRVVDSANLLSPAEEARIVQLSTETEQASTRQLVVATVPDLQGYPIEDYGYRLGRAWGIGQKGANNGVILLVALSERRVRIEVGYGLEPIVTDALSSVIINNSILPRFRQGDMGGGVLMGAEALAEQLKLPLEAAEARAARIVQQRQKRATGSNEGGIGIPIFWVIVLLFVVVPMLFGRARGKRYRRGGGWPVVLWGPGLGGGWGGGGGGSSWGGGGGGGGFSGGGGSFGGGGASGSW